MALSLTLEAKENVLYKKFDNAYWCVENIAFGSADNIMYVNFELNTYPSRDAKYKNLQPLEPSELPIGGAIGIAYSPLIHTWQATFKVSDVFKSGIPLEESEQKRILYYFVKEYTKLPFEDVLE